MGSETSSHEDRKADFQLTQRAEFFEERVGLETTLKRPIINTRDEPHADPHRYRRLHVIVGDANLAEVATLLKVGTTSLVLAMIEDNVSGTRDLDLADPVAAMHQVSFDRTLARPLEMSDGSTATALDIQWELFSLARKYADDRGLECMGNVTVGEEVLRRWEMVLQGLETDPMSLSRQLDWVAKLRLLDGYRQRHGCGWDDHRLAAMDLQYHDLRPDRSLFQWLDTEKLVDRGGCDQRHHRAPPEYPGLVPGAVPDQMAGGGGHRQLGFIGLRPRHRSVAARPDDGPPTRHGRSRGRTIAAECNSVGVVGSAEQLGRVTDG